MSLAAIALAPWLGAVVVACLPGQARTQRGLYDLALAGEALTGVEATFLHGTLDRPWQDGACPRARPCA